VTRLAVKCQHIKKYEADDVVNITPKEAGLACGSEEAKDGLGLTVRLLVLGDGNQLLLLLLLLLLVHNATTMALKPQWGCVERPALHGGVPWAVCGSWW
jgi:hypothetical protein